MRNIRSKARSKDKTARQRTSPSHGKSFGAKSFNEETPKTSPRAKGKCLRTVNRLSQGTGIVSERFRYVVKQPILCHPQRLFEVYKVAQNGAQMDYALKLETDLVSNRLKAELHVLQLFSSISPEKKQHFPQMIDRGQTNDIRFIVMNFLGPTLYEIRRGMMNKREFNRYTAGVIASQTFEALSDLHELGIAHREICLSNFAIGMPPKDDTIYLMGYTSAKDFNGRMGIRETTPRQTTIYAPRGGRSIRIEDLEAWLYLVADVYSQSALPWCHLKDKAEINKAKDRFFQLDGTTLEYNRIPASFEKIIKIIDALKGIDEPSYSKVRDHLFEMRNKDGASDGVLDWILRRKKREKRSNEAFQNPADRDDFEEEKKEKLPVPQPPPTITPAPTPMKPEPPAPKALNLAEEEERIQKALAELLTTESRRDDDVDDMEKNNMIFQLKKKREELWKKQNPQEASSPQPPVVVRGSNELVDERETFLHQAVNSKEKVSDPATGTGTDKSKTDSGDPTKCSQQQKQSGEENSEARLDSGESAPTKPRVRRIPTISGKNPKSRSRSSDRESYCQLQNRNYAQQVQETEKSVANTKGKSQGIKKSCRRKKLESNFE
ncbi:hypothetical protein L596_014284 [Steinernema carpocapsae]|uniref:Protein kinase domain-containing protein n=1 Tax=Steinernema carpocapsae TaxID=34508 RepID=A0A4U5NC05_STECR|nr:hypothetical protein L596_014284 [Steinernema carpocapsae]